jgi:hypothetical protein
MLKDKDPADLSDSEIQTARSLELKLGLPMGTFEDSIGSQKEILTHIVSDDKTQATIVYKDGTTKVIGTGLTATIGDKNKLTLTEAKSLGLPLSLVGMSEADIGNDLASTSPPQWFKEIKEEEEKMSIIPSVLTKLWNDFKNSIFSKLKTAGTTGGIINPFE